MNIIVTNKYKDLIYGTNIEVLKELHGVYKVSQIANSFSSIFYRKIIIDATALDGFPKEQVLKELVATFDADKLILFLPPDNPPPKKFLSFLVNINLYNFTDNPQGLVELTRKSNTYEEVKAYIDSKNDNGGSVEPVRQENFNNSTDLPSTIIIGFNGVTEKSYVTELIYSLKRTLEDKYKKDVIAIELNKQEFGYYNYSNMYSIPGDKLDLFLQNNMSSQVILIDLNNVETNSCNDLIYLVNPSLYTTNKLLYKMRDAFVRLKGKKIVFVNSLLNENDVNQFAREANISVFYNLPPLNDRVHNFALDKLLGKLGIIDNNDGNKNTKKGILDIFK